MKEAEMNVSLLAATALKEGAIERYLDSIGAGEFVTKELAPGGLRTMDDGSELVRFAGKLCYNSYVPGLNPNVTKVTEGGPEYIANILKQGHGSVLEHVTGTFLLEGVSRVLTHELVRHRVGIAYSQESLRYVRLEKMEFWMPRAFDELLGPELASKVKRVIEEAVKAAEGDQAEMAGLAVKKDLKFGELKRLTSAFRRIAPMGLATKIVVTANVRTLRHLILLRTSMGAEEEIRAVFDQIARICKEEWPALFQDFEPYYAGVEAAARLGGHEPAPPEWRCKNSQQPYGS